jgi:hypothetical protein
LGTGIHITSQIVILSLFVNASAVFCIHIAFPQIDGRYIIDYRDARARARERAGNGCAAALRATTSCDQ